MACRIITVSRSMAAGGEEIARILAKKLGFRYADRQIVIRAAQEAGVSPETAAQAERTPGVVARILDSLASTPIEPVWSSYEALASHAEPAYEGLFESVIRETANAGKVVIVSHGASFPLAGMSGLMRVFVTASPQVRVQRLARDGELDERRAKKAIAESDRQRRDYLRRFYNIRQELPTHYDLVVNTDILTQAQAAQLIISAAKGL
jgi:cytidylate kinase